MRRRSGDLCPCAEVQPLEYKASHDREQLIGGLYELIAALWTHMHGWGWQALNGVLAAVLGSLLLTQWPVSGLYAIGLFIGIDLIFYGASWIKMAIELHKM